MSKSDWMALIVCVILLSATGAFLWYQWYLG